MYVDSDGNVHVVGLVRNGGSSTLLFPQVGVSFKNAGGTVIAETDTAAPGVVRPGQDFPFDAVLEDPPAGIVSYTTSYLGATAFPVPADELTIAVTSFDGSSVSGTVTNTGDEEYETNATVAAALFNSAGDVIRVDFGESEAPIPANSSVPFSVVFVEPATGAASARAWIVF
jgi:hypothetical protein